MVGDYLWKCVGSAGEQERRMERACFLGPYALRIVETGWRSDDAGGHEPVWTGIVMKWDQQHMQYDEHYKTKTEFGLAEACQNHLEDWYANNVLFEHLVWDKDDGKDRKSI